MEETKETKIENIENSASTVVEKEADVRGDKKPMRRPKRQQRGGGQSSSNENANFDIKIIDIRRVSKMTKGGRTMKLSVFVAVGDKNGSVGLGLGKGEDVRQAQDKAILNAKKNMVKIRLKGNTIPHNVNYKYKAARVFLKPAVEGTGIVAGSSVRLIAEVAGVQDMLSKILGTNNKITNAYAMLNALASMK